MMTDPIADMLTRIRNATRVHKSEAVIPYSKLKYRIAELLVREGFLAAVEKTDDPRAMRVAFKYHDTSPAIQAIRRISKPGRRVYAPATELPRVRQDTGIAIVSTSAGILTNKEARKRRLGGEVLCEVY
ncbi:30S ribosomal protein S8 [Candidatus Uhrbacteria bacterium]|nr:30S ribosomal protein S8 [Candidatus Uhrbacteria bacterium]